MSRYVQRLLSWENRRPDKRAVRWISPKLHVRLFFWLVLAAQTGIPQFAAAQAESAGEYELKAAILYNLTRFVEWPPTAYPNPQAPTILCIFGRDPFGASLSSIVAKQAPNGRQVQIRHVRSDKEVGGCHVLYISSSERKQVAQILSTAAGSNILTVGEIGQFAARGGMIQFGLEDKEVRFDVNLDAALRAGLKISSRLLVLARVVKPSNSDSGSESGNSSHQQAMAVLESGVNIWS
jgi:uncharacterized protein DUF4154